MFDENSLYHFRSQRSRDWAAQNDPVLVESVRGQLTRFWDRVATKVLDQDHVEDEQNRDTMPDGYVALYALAREYKVSQYFVKRAIKTLDTISRVKYKAEGWRCPRSIWIAEEEEARACFEQIRAEQEQALSFIPGTKEPKVLLEPPEGAMSISEISKAIGMNKTTLGRWIREKAVPSAGKFMTKHDWTTSCLEVYTWPGPVIAEIVRRSALSDNRRPLRWFGLEELKCRGHEDWIESARICRVRADRDACEEEHG